MSDVNVQQIYIYRNKLWIMFCEYGEYDKNELGVIDFKEDEVNTYRGIYPKGKSICINNGYLYFNSSGLKRLNLEDNSVEEVFEQNVEGINFTVDNILCYVGKRLFAINTNGVKELKRLTGETAGFGGIRIEENMIYIHSFQGAFSNQIYQIDEEGRIIKKID